MEITDEIKKAYEIAKEFRQKAIAPYSKFLVGAATKFVGDDKIYPGFNIENSSYGATVCAERSSIFSGLIADNSHKIEYMVLITDTHPVATPCGICRQVINEFVASKETKIYLSNLEGVQKALTINELLPHAFDPAALEV